MSDIFEKADGIFNELFDDADSFEKVDTDRTKTLSDVIRQLAKLDDEINEQEEYVKSLRARRHKIVTEVAPDLMDEMTLEKIEVDGVKVSKKTMVHASIPVANREEAFTWLRDRNLDDIIKNDVSVTFGRGEDNVAGVFMEEMRRNGLNPKQKTHIHAQTLKAFIKERITQGKEIDLDLFGAYVAPMVEIRRTK
jgi:hypothetical protein